jgi:hypothetical protein
MNPSILVSNTDSPLYMLTMPIITASIVRTLAKSSVQKTTSGNKGTAITKG